MSRSNPAPINPAHKFFEWAGAKGQLEYFDKEAKEAVKVSLPFSFLVLDELTTVTGWSESDNSRIWSNEVRSLKDELTVRTGAGTIITGTYDEVKDKLKAQGGKYASSVYIAYQESNGEDGEWVIGNIRMAGASLGAWIDFRKHHNVDVVGVRITGSHEEKKGSNTFHVPDFIGTEVQDADNNEAVELDIQLQQYLGTYLKHKREELVAEKVASEDVVLEDFDEDAPIDIDLAEIPF